MSGTKSNWPKHDTLDYFANFGDNFLSNKSPDVAQAVSFCLILCHLRKFYYQISKNLLFYQGNKAKNQARNLLVY